MAELVKLATGGSIAYEPPTDVIDTPTRDVVARAMGVLERLAEQTKTVTADPALSEVGRTQKLEPARTHAITVIADAFAAATMRNATADRLEAGLFTPPPRAADAVEALEDRELRDHWKSLSVEARADILKGFIQGENDRLLVALLRSPIPLAEAETKVARNAWAQKRRTAEPGIQGRINAERLNGDWAQRQIYAIAHAAKNATGWNRQRLAEVLVKAGATREGMRVFGL